MQSVVIELANMRVAAVAMLVAGARDIRCGGELRTRVHVAPERRRRCAAARRLGLLSDERAIIEDVQIKSRCLGAIVVLSVAATAFAIVPVAAVTLPGDTMLVTSTIQLGGGAGRQVWWYSGDGTTGVVTNYSASGQVEDIEKIVYSAPGDFLDHTDTVLFPQQSSWAVDVIKSGCSTATCDASEWLYPSPPLTAKLLASHEMQLVGRSKTIDGVKVRAVETTPKIGTVSAVVGWVDPTNDEIVQYQIDASQAPQIYKWVRASKSTNRHLDVSIPHGYTKLSAECAAPVGHPILPDLGANDPCR